MTTCTHSTFNHVFYSVLCPYQSAALKVAKAALAVFIIVGVALITYSPALTGRTRAITRQQSDRLPLADHSEKGREALEYARKLLADYSAVEPKQFEQKPVNEEISKLSALLWGICKDDLENAHKECRDNPWSQDKVLQAADRCMKVAYAISCLTLEDLEAFTKRVKGTDKEKGYEDMLGKVDGCTDQERSFIRSLVRQDSYQYRTYFNCSQVYHWLRGGVVWSAHHFLKNEPEALYFPREKVGEVHYEAYYTEGTLQNSWNQLYNEFCDRVKMYVPMEKLGKADSRHFMWACKDTVVDTFRPEPTTLPT